MNIRVEDVMWMIDIWLFYLLFMELVTIRPHHKNKRRGTWVQEETLSDVGKKKLKKNRKRRK
ncbi:hypothetical protein TFLX_03111 [Thermoflexales bacterium]|nr:hypothetical protein TFLX_03111 [Thermoflexales bacterium]